MFRSPGFGLTLPPKSLIHQNREAPSTDTESYSSFNALKQRVLQTDRQTGAQMLDPDVGPGKPSAPGGRWSDRAAVAPQGSIKRGQHTGLLKPLPLLAV